MHLSARQDKHLTQIVQKGVNLQDRRWRRASLCEQQAGGQKHLTGWVPNISASCETVRMKERKPDRAVSYSSKCNFTVSVTGVTGRLDWLSVWQAAELHFSESCWVQTLAMIILRIYNISFTLSKCCLLTRWRLKFGICERQLMQLHEINHSGILSKQKLQIHSKTFLNSKSPKQLDQAILF